MRFARLVVLLFVTFAISCSGSDSGSPDTSKDMGLTGDLVSKDSDTAMPDADSMSEVAPTDTGTDGCVPACDDLQCGPDGCGGNCGQCGGLQVCLDGQCCSPACDAKNCGPDGCGGSCGACDEAVVCLDGQCCEADCADKDCGPDGCGGSCGACGPSEFCMEGSCSAPDQDYDGVPDEADLFPQDPDYPGIALPSTVYAQTSDTLYSMDVKMYKLEKVGDFGWPADGYTHKMTDIGIDGFGVMYGTSFEYLYTCHPQTAECHLVAKLPSAFNGMTMVPAGPIDPDRDVMVGISEEGGWFRLDLIDGELKATELGGYGSKYSSTGDAYSISGVGTFASVYKDDSYGNYLVALNPATGKVLMEIGPIGTYNGIFGLAGWTDKAFAFDKTGDVLVIDTSTAEVKLLHETEMSWWGAGVATKL